MPSEYQNATVRPASLEEETRTVIEEARMVLPGIQAFFGFQLIAVFNNRFQEFTHTEQVLWAARDTSPHARQSEQGTGPA